MMYICRLPDSSGLNHENGYVQIAYQTSPFQLQRRDSA